MIARSNSSMTRTVFLVGALTLAAVIFALPADALVKSTPYGRCSGRCQIGDQYCFWECRCAYKNQCGNVPTPKKAFVSPARKPITVTGAPTRPTHRHQ